MGFWDTILQIMPWACLWDTVSQHLGYIKDLSKNVDCLMSETNALKRKRDEFQADVAAAEKIGKKKLRCVDDWFSDVDKIVPEVDSIKLEFDQGTINPFSQHKIGKRVVEKMKDVKNIQDRGVFHEVAKSPCQQPVREVPEQLQRQTTSEETLEKITQALSDEEVGTVCIYGMGGIGKTTLMKAIYNKFIQNTQFDRVIWVTVSKDLNLQVIQKKIGNKLDVEFLGNEDTEEMRDKLYARLINVRYMLILDDLWDAFPLDQVGIPQPNKQNHCKVAITTRLIAVSSMMMADCEIKVKALSNKEAWDLFCTNTGDVVLEPEIQRLAEEVVKECGGLPLAIKTVAAAMRRKGKKELWQNALRALRASAVPDVPGMQHEVFLPLKLSYDYLEDPKIQLCFLYCSLYPEDYKIPSRKLVRLWAFEEELIDNVNCLDEALKKGQSILERLKDACLLEELDPDWVLDEHEDRPYFRMHDLLRDLAIWITSPSFSSSSSCFPVSKFLVKAGEGLEQPPEEKLWECTRRISLMSNKIRELQIVPNCPELVSLMLCGNEQLLTIHESFFCLMPKLQILDLSNTGIKSLPSSLSLLVTLHVLVVRSCTNLQEIPPLGDLKELQLLDLNETAVENLPQGIASLSKLKCLDLSYTNVLCTNACNVISRLTSLEELQLLGWKQMMSVDNWREVATLRSLTSLTILLPSLDVFPADDLNHPMWSRLSRFLVQFGLKGSLMRSSSFERTVCIYDCQCFPSQIKGLMRNVESLFVNGCQGLECPSQIIGDSKSLKHVSLEQVQDVKCVLDWRDVGKNNALYCLEVLSLRTLPSLQKVFDGGSPTCYQQLRKIFVSDCPKLTCIFSPNMFQHLHQLEVLDVSNCKKIEKIVEGGLLPDVALQRLRSLCLHLLPKIMTICSQRLVLTSMESLVVSDCPELRKLPGLCSRIKRISGEIKGRKEWWEGIEWEDEHSKSLYSTVYREG